MFVVLTVGDIHADFVQIGSPAQQKFVSRVGQVPRRCNLCEKLDCGFAHPAGMA